jgi:Rne/Rng family ribonuclease
VERGEKRSHVGDIYKGRVNAVLPGMQAAFVEIGLPKTAFLHASDLAENLADLDEFEGDDEPSGRGGGGRRQRRPVPKIEDCLKKGQEILVQVTKESIGTKGPRVTQQVSLPGRFTVFMPGVDHSGVSRRIEDRGERQRLKALVAQHRPKGAGLIVRTAGDGKGEKEFANDVNYLIKLWEKVDRKSKTARAPALIHRELELTTGLIRDLFTEDVEELVIELLPSWPRTFEPQHITPPAKVMAQVCACVSVPSSPPPAAIPCAGPGNPTTDTGVRRCVVVPSPSWPSALAPQHRTGPDDVATHVWNSPAAMSVARSPASPAGGRASPDTAMRTNTMTSEG